LFDHYRQRGSATETHRRPRPRSTPMRVTSRNGFVRDGARFRWPAFAPAK
jgi:hypothetical protein